MLQINQRTQGQVYILEMKGRFVSSTEFPFWNAVQKVVVEEGARKLVLDFQDVSQCDSFGISELIRVRNSLNNIGAELILASLNPLVRRVLEITKVEDLFEIRSSVDTATRELQPADLSS